MSGRLINDYIRQKVRHLRRARGKTLKEMAAALEMPLTSYSSLEYGQCNISVSRLCRILGVLNADIATVWPPENWVRAKVQSDLYTDRVQAFRLSELATITGAQGAALFRTIRLHTRKRTEILIQIGLSDEDLERITYCLEDERVPEHGFSLGRARDEIRLDLYLTVEKLNADLRPLAYKYLEIWSELFF